MHKKSPIHAVYPFYRRPEDRPELVLGLVFNRRREQHYCRTQERFPTARQSPYVSDLTEDFIKEKPVSNGADHWKWMEDKDETAVAFY